MPIEIDVIGAEDEVVDKSAGVGHRILFQYEKNLVLANVPAEPVNKEDEVIISADHTFVDEEAGGWKRAYIDEEKADALFRDEGGISVNALKAALTIFIPGDSAKLAAFLKDKPRLVVLVPPLNCAGPGKKVQIGTHCSPAKIVSYQMGMGKYDGSEGKGFTVEIMAMQDRILFYTGETPLEEA